MDETVAQYYHRLYLTYWNEFLTMDGFASHYGINLRHANRIIRKGRLIHHQQFESVLQMATQI